MLRVGGESHNKKLADLKPWVGGRVERALEILGLSKQEAAYAMGYTDAGTVSRWCSATERPQLDKLFALKGFLAAWVVSLAEEHPEAMTVETIVKIRRTA